MPYHRIISTVRTDFVIEAETTEEAWKQAEEICCCENHPAIVSRVTELEVQPSEHSIVEAQLDSIPQCILDFVTEANGDPIGEDMR